MILRLFFICIFLGINAFAINLPDKPYSRVIDQTNTLTTNQKQILVDKLDNIYNTESHTEIQVLIISSLNNEPIEDVTLSTARKWKIGQKGINNGAIILIAIQDHKYRIETGYGLEGQLPDGYLGNLERNVMTPYFAKGDFFNGLNIMISDLSQQIGKDYKTKIRVNNSSVSPQNAIVYVSFGVGIFIIIGLLGIATRNPGKLTEILWFLLKILTLFALFRGSNNRNDDDDIGGGGDFGGGGSSNKW